MTIEKNLSNIISQLNNRAKLIAVTKYRSIDEIKQVVDYGIKDLGENRVQELLDKYDKIEDNVNWHLIGHLQRNKVKYIIDKVHLIHSVDSLRLASEIDTQSNKIGRCTNILIQCNVSKEESKYGVYPEDLEDFLISTRELKNIKIKGLMTMAPYTENIEETRYIFKKLKFIYDKIRHDSTNISNLSLEYLSMGMTNDYNIAIEEGSNMVRIGTGIFQS